MAFSNPLMEEEEEEVAPVKKPTKEKKGKKCELPYPPEEPQQHQSTLS